MGGAAGLMAACWCVGADGHAPMASGSDAGPGRLGGTGVRFVPVAHEGNRNESPEEAAVVGGWSASWSTVAGPGPTAMVGATSSSRPTC
jgi:hypothetical protein